jgi:hypothetical protein
MENVILSCRVCGRPPPVGFTVTCGESFCQEADYLRSLERRSRRGSRARAEASARAVAAEESARKKAAP